MSNKISIENDKQYVMKSFISGGLNYIGILALVFYLVLGYDVMYVYIAIGFGLSIQLPLLIIQIKAINNSDLEVHVKQRFRKLAYVVFVIPVIVTLITTLIVVL